MTKYIFLLFSAFAFFQFLSNALQFGVKIEHNCEKFSGVPDGRFSWDLVELKRDFLEFFLC